MARIRVAMAQLDLVVGDLDGNVDRIVAAVVAAEGERCDLVVLPELAITGYPPEDLLLKPAFVRDSTDALARVAAAAVDVVAIVGVVEAEGDRLWNAAAVCHGGEVVGTYRKRRLPNYSVFDEQRYFTAGQEPLRLWEVAGIPVGVTVCEDAWAPAGPIPVQAGGGARLIVNLNASPYHAGKVGEREGMLAERANEADCPIVYVNLVGGQDELVFDGGSLVVGADGRVLATGPQFVEDLTVVDLDVGERPTPAREPLPVEPVTTVSWAEGLPELAPPFSPPLPRGREIYEALVLGTRDYVRKNGFEEVVVGLSGGIDSSLVATIAADALGPERVHGVLMPSRWSSEHSVHDAEALAEALGIESRVVPIEPAHAAFEAMLAPSFLGTEPDLTEENLQSRIRGVLLMALSNKHGWMVLTTSNKSESAVGYSTLYGDSAGGFAVIKDLPKLWVYELCRERNAQAEAAGERPPVPAAVIDKPPSAELRPDQRDDQSLPPYEVLDPIIEAYVEQDRTVGDLIDGGHEPTLVRRIARLVDLAEYKRRQFPPGPRVTTKAFGKDRRLPITNGYRR